MKTTIILLRHGDVNNPKKIFYGRSIEVTLSKKGKKQLVLVGKKLVKEKLYPKVIYSSPLKRAIQSAKIIIKVLKKRTPLHLEIGLIDVEIPSLVGHPIKEREIIHNRKTDEYDAEFVARGHEARTEIVSRMEAAFWRIVKINQGKISLIVSHGDPLRFLLFRLFNKNSPVRPIHKDKDPNYMNKGQAIKLILDETGRIIEKRYIN